LLGSAVALGGTIYLVYIYITTDITTDKTTDIDTLIHTADNFVPDEKKLLNMDPVILCKYTRSLHYENQHFIFHDILQSNSTVIGGLALFITFYTIQ
jgi:hypothetical protein